MRPGPLEIILIIVVIIAVAVIARIIRTGRIATRRNGDSTIDITTSPPEKNRMWNFFNRTGIALIIAGILFLIAAASMLRYAFQSYALAFTIIAVGFIIVFVLRKKR